MQPLAEPVQNLIDAFTALPGIGPKTASRLAYYLLRGDESIALNLARALEVLNQHGLLLGLSQHRHRDPCPICTDHNDHGLICVVEEPLDVQAIERTREYHGVYHVLHGAISPVEGVGPEDFEDRGTPPTRHSTQPDGRPDGSHRGRTDRRSAGVAAGHQPESGRRGHGHVHLAPG
ncbi:MAG: toprim domain-containing protein [Caldilineaceae bacterium]